MTDDLMGPEEALRSAYFKHDNDEYWRKSSSSFVCPNCQAYAQHVWGSVHQLSIYDGVATRTRYAGSPFIQLALCQVCDVEIVFVDGRVTHPQISDAPTPTADMPEEVYADFMEARSIAQASPRGAAALLRLVIQKLCPLLGASKTGINEAIGELVKSGRISTPIQQALDIVRVVGNEAVHPGTIDFRDDAAIALKLFRIVNFIVEKGITEPKQLAEIYGNLPPVKLDHIERRDA